MLQYRYKGTHLACLVDQNQFPTRSKSASMSRGGAHTSIIASCQWDVLTRSCNEVRTLGVMDTLFVLKAAMDALLERIPLTGGCTLSQLSTRCPKAARRCRRKSSLHLSSLHKHRAQRSLPQHIIPRGLTFAYYWCSSSRLFLEYAVGPPCSEWPSEGLL